MPWYRVKGTVTVSAWTLVEAESEEAAVRNAMDRGCGLCPYGPSQDGVTPTECGVIEEADGSLISTGAALITRAHAKRLDDGMSDVFDVDDDSKEPS